MKTFVKKKLRFILDFFLNTIIKIIQLTKTKILKTAENISSLEANNSYKMPILNYNKITKINKSQKVS